MWLAGAVAQGACGLQSRQRSSVGRAELGGSLNTECRPFAMRGGLMAATVATVAYLGLEARAVEVQVQLSSGLPAFIIVGLPDKAVAESRERVRAALAAIGLALPPKRITVNLSPADLPKEGSHFDLPIALCLLAAIGATDAESLSHYVAVGELSLDGRIAAVAGRAARRDPRLGARQGADLPRRAGQRGGLGGRARSRRRARPAGAARASQGHGAARAAAPGEAEPLGRGPDLSQVKGQEVAKRALEIAAAGGHNLLMSGPPGAGKSLLAACLPGILPPLEPSEALEVSMVASVAGELNGGRSAAAARSARRTTPRRCRRWSAAGCASGRARSASRIWACCSSTSCPNSSARCSIRCASRSKPAASASPAPTPM